MRPALSIVIFTVTSGLGYGWVFIFLLLDLSGVSPFSEDSGRIVAGVIAIALITVGLVSSTTHLANPKNAWRAVVRVRTSWLSREAVLALLFYPLFTAYLFAATQDPTSGLSVILGCVSAVVAIATVATTAMIYACLRTIRQWRTPLTPVNFVAMALALGGLAHLVFRALRNTQPIDVANTAVMFLLLIAFAGKLAYYLQFSLPDSSRINAATGFKRAKVRLLDVGHTAGTFLTREFGFEVSHALLAVLKVLALAFGFALPALIVARTAEPLPLVGALVLAYIGALVERWLFFAEAQHVVRLYHGQDAT